MRMGLAQPSGAATTRTDDGAPQRVTAGPSLFVLKLISPFTNKQPYAKTPPVCPCEPLCAILLAKASVYPAFGSESEREPFVTDCTKAVE